MDEITQEDMARLQELFHGIYPTLHRARKDHRCRFGRRYTGGPRCEATIRPGEQYVAGPCNFEAGPWSRDYWCAACVLSTRKAAA